MHVRNFAYLSRSLGLRLAQGKRSNLFSPLSTVTAQLQLNVQRTRSVVTTSETPKDIIPTQALKMIPDRSSTLSRLMNPDDANIAGNVHGGEILRLIDEAGRVAAMRHCNSSGKLEEAVEVCLARIDKIDFVRPMLVGEIAQVDAVVTYASEHSLEVTATVYAENLLTGDRRRTNQGTLWYVGVDANNIAPNVRQKKTDEGMTLSKPSLLPVKVPKLDFDDVSIAEAAEERYKKQKASRSSPLQAGKQMVSVSSLMINPNQLSAVVPTTFSMAILPGHCNNVGSVHGGVLLKLMDEAGAMAAFRHCRRNNCVTASFDSLNFEAPVFLGDVVTVSGWPTYVSNKSIECEVVVMVENLKTGKRYQAVTTHLTCVSLDVEGKTLEVPPLPNPLSEFEKDQRALGQQRYERSKAERLKKAALSV